VLIYNLDPHGDAVCSLHVKDRRGYSTFHLANKKMITHRTRISDPYVSSFDVILRSLEEAASTSNQCSNSTANSTTTNTTCVYGTCRPVFYQNTRYKIVFILLSAILLRINRF
jgi:hypothetical protein